MKLPTSVVILLAGLCAMMLPACGQANYENENDLLRAQAIEHEKQLDQLQHRITELETELEVASAAPGSLPEDIRAATPHVSEIRIAKLSHARDSDGDGVIDQLRLYIESSDGMGRAIQLVGHLSVHAAILPAQSDAITIGRMDLSPQQLRDAYRSGITGTHYTIEVPVSPPADSPDASSEVRLTFRDGLTGRELTATRTIKLRD